VTVRVVDVVGWAGPTGRITGATYYELPGQGFANLTFNWADPSGTTGTTPYVVTNLTNGLISTPITLPNDPTVRVIGTNTRIQYGIAMSEIQLIYQYGENGEYIGTTDWPRNWPYNEAYTLMARSGWQLNRLCAGVIYGAAIAAIKISTGPIV
jgi:hypothetical protein